MSKTFINANSLDWLDDDNNKILGSILIGPPDMSEININVISEYYKFLHKVARLTMSKLLNGEFLIVIMTDRFWNENGCDKFVDKMTPFIQESMNYDCNLLFKKIIEVNNNTVHESKLKTKYQNMSNIVVFKKGSCDYKISKNVLTTDIYRKKHDKLWIKGVYINVIDELIKFLKYNNVSHISDFFAGYGTTLLVAEKHGIDSFGIELLKHVYEKGLKSSL